MARQHTTRLIVSDACLGLTDALAQVFPAADWQRCAVRFYRNVFSHVPSARVREVAAMLKAIHAQESREAAESKAADVVKKLKGMKLRAAAELVQDLDEIRGHRGCFFGFRVLLHPLHPPIPIFKSQGLLPRPPG